MATYIIQEANTGYCHAPVLGLGKHLPIKRNRVPEIVQLLQTIPIFPLQLTAGEMVGCLGSILA